MAEGFINKYVRFCGSRELAWLIGINIAVSIFVWAAGIILSISHTNDINLHSWLAMPSDAKTFLHRPWTLLTYMFTQFSPLHLLFNVLWLYWFGRLTIYSIGGRQLLRIYVAGGLAGSLAYLAATACGVSAGGYLCGASASVLAIMCVVAITMPDFELNLFIFGRVKMKWFAAVCVILTLVGASSSEAGTIAHAGGMTFGIIYGLVSKGTLKRYKVSLKERSDNIKKRFKPDRPKNAEAAANAMRGRLSDHDRLDQLLDKIRLSGFSSLSETERLELDALSKRIKN